MHGRIGGEDLLRLFLVVFLILCAVQAKPTLLFQIEHTFTLDHFLPVVTKFFLLIFFIYYL